MAVVVVASIGMALSTFVGATIAAIPPWLLVPILAIWTYLTGLAVCLGPRPSVAVLQWSIALLIAGGLPAGYQDAAFRACLVLAGGLFQAALVAISWALWPGSKERTALAASYRVAPRCIRPKDDPIAGKSATRLLSFRSTSQALRACVGRTQLRRMDEKSLEATLKLYLKHIREGLEQSAAIARAAETCAEAGNLDKGIEIALDIEQRIFEVNTLLNAAGLIHRKT